MKKTIISDASSLILLQKILLLDKLIKNFEFVIPPEVYSEAVIKGKGKKSEDAYRLEEKIKDNKITIKKVKDGSKINQIIKEFNLAKGETEAIVLFLQEKADLIAIDDHKAINVCKIYGIPFFTALTFILHSFENNIINKEKSREMIQKLAMYGRYKDEIIKIALDKMEGKNG